MWSFRLVPCLGTVLCLGTGSCAMGNAPLYAAPAYAKTCTNSAAAARVARYLVRRQLCSLWQRHYGRLGPVGRPGILSCVLVTADYNRSQSTNRARPSKRVETCSKSSQPSCKQSSPESQLLSQPPSPTGFKPGYGWSLTNVRTTGAIGVGVGCWNTGAGPKL